MTFEEAIVKSVKAYLDGTVPKELLEVSEDSKYTPEYFDELEKEIMEGPVEEVEDEEDEDE
mgnify:CR=1 FL=1